MYSVRFINKKEIRMGSPFNMANIDLKGDFLPDFTGIDFQDIAVITDNGSICFLVQWDILVNDPGFNVLKLDSNIKVISKSCRIVGCCQKIEISRQQVILQSWNYDVSEKKEKFATYQLNPSDFLVMQT